MKVVLTKRVEGLGLEGDVVTVKDGYARNYLIPKGLALEATEGNIKALEQKKKTYELKVIRKREEALRLKELIEKTNLIIKRKTQEEGKIFGSVTSSDISEALEKKGFQVDRKKILLERPIKALGEYQISIKLFPQIEARINVAVEPE